MIADPVTLATVIARHAPDLMARPGVIGVGEGESSGQPCVLVFVAAGPAPPPVLPAELDGYPVVVRESGRFAAGRLKGAG